jgi:hypothetical protein
MGKKRILWLIGGWSGVIVALLAMSYCSELPKQRFEYRSAESTNGVPGARAIGSKKGFSITSPISWFWPAITESTIALPDPRVADRFYTMTLTYGAKQPLVFLVDADCQARTLTFFGPDEPESAAPARDLFGSPVVATNGKTYRRLHSNPDSPAAWVVDFCDTDWSAEREAIEAAQTASRQPWRRTSHCARFCCRVTIQPSLPVARESSSRWRGLPIAAAPCLFYLFFA